MSFFLACIGLVWFCFGWGGWIDRGGGNGVVGYLVIGGNRILVLVCSPGRLLEGLFVFYLFFYIFFLRTCCFSSFESRTMFHDMISCKRILST